ncbi:MAG TPA: GspMb/PilO family protein [Blastocatellia bacterium]|nr:GspMb/PilO family protein [Blastocatellia bacterium]
MSSYVRERIFKQERAEFRRDSRLFGLSAIEVVAAFLTLVFLAVVIGYYFTTLRPQQDRLDRLERELQQQQADIVGVRASESGPSQVDLIKETLGTLETFKSDHLKPRSKGIITLFKDFNDIAAKNSVRLMSGINMREERSGPQVAENRAKTSESLLDQFPSVQIDFTVSGQYQNLRNFISDLERIRQFIVIDSIQLINVEDSGVVGRRSQSAGVALSIRLTAYFQD